MLCKLAKGLVLAAALSGLCPATQANTTVGLLLPMRSSTLGAAANAVLAGVKAAYARETDDISISLLETDGTAQDVLAGYADAVARFDIVIGPLARSEVTAIAQSGKVSKLSIMLAQPDAAGDAETVLPPQMLAIGLSVEDEARQVANWVNTDKMVSKAFVVSTNAAWQRRAAKAFVAEWRNLGLVSQAMELGISDGYLSANSLVQLKKRLQADNPALLFVALDAGQTAQLRLAIGTDIPMYGTSQLNPLVGQDEQASGSMTDMDGAHLLDIPWQLQPDHPAVMVYPRLAVDADRPRNADLARLYALGIDAYRVAREVAGGRTTFQIDGVTGKLTVSFGKGPAHFERIEQTAIYQDGVAVPLIAAP